LFEAIDDYSVAWLLGERQNRHLLKVVNEIMPDLTAGRDAAEVVDQFAAGRRRRAAR
jgi:hypothetical protein